MEREAEMQRFTWNEMRTYWENLASRVGPIDYRRDPDGLTIVCSPGAPLWLNKYYAFYQSLVFRRLLSKAPKPRAGAKALDVGCGTGRWSRLLAESGYKTTGLDIQPSVIESNRSRFPHIEFHCVAIQDYVRHEEFDLISCVTVLQHIPFSDQDGVIRKLRSLLRTHGYAIVLENIHDQGRHVFSNSVEGWTTRFKRAGFGIRTIQRYDYNPFLRLSALSANIVLSRTRTQSIDGVAPDPGLMRGAMAYQERGASQSSMHILRLLEVVSQGVSLGLDAMLEPVLVSRNLALPTVHCGFLLEAV